MSKECAELTQEIFEGQPSNVVIACVDYDGLLKFGDNIRARYTWASERWRGPNWVAEREDTNFKPLTCLVREAVENANS